MRIVKIRVTNFRSFVGTQEFELPAEPGLYSMTGVNLAEPRLGANGSGKSSLWSAITWCYHGRTPDGLKGGDVCNWDKGKGTKVEVVSEDLNGIEYTVTRTWGPISFKLRSRDLTGEHGDFDDTEDVDQKDPKNPVLSIITRMDFVPWSQSVMMAQGEPMFLDMKAEPQAALFGEVMGLDRWITASAEAGRRAATQDVVTRGLEREQAELVGRLDVVTRGDTRVRAEAWAAAQADRIEALVADHAKLCKHRETLKDKRAEAAENETNRRALYQSVKNEHEGPADRLKRAKAAVSEAEAFEDLARRDAERLGEIFQNFDEGGDCPTCGHRLSKDELGESRRKSRQAAVKATESHQKAIQMLGRASNDLRDAERSCEGFENSLIDARVALDVAIDEARDAARELQRCDADLDRMEDDAARLDAEVNPFAGMVADLAREASEIRGRLAECRRELGHSEAKQSIFQFWVRGFKEVRLRQIAEALRELEIEVNSCCAALGLDGWEIRFAVDKETKGGGIKTGFAVTVKSPANEEAVPWASWSGGEKQRLRIAGNMGLADLIRSRTGSEISLEVWDEPTQGLHAGGVVDLLQALESRARNERRQIWIVDHRSHSFGGFAGGAVVTKTAAGSSIEAA